MKYTKIFFSILLLAYSFTGCIKDIEGPQKIADLERAIGIPVVYSKVTMADIVSPSDSILNIEIDPVEGNYVMNISGVKHDFQKAGELIKFGRNGISISTIPGVPIIDAAGTVETPTTTFGVDFAQGDSTLAKTRVRNVIFKDGTLSMNLQSTMSKTVDVEVEFPNIINTLNNTTLKLNYVLLQNTSSLQSKSLKDHRIDLNGTFDVQMKLKISVRNGGTQPIQQGNLLINSFNLNNLDWQRINGQVQDLRLSLVNSQTFELSDILIKPFSNTENEAQTDSFIVYFEKPQLDITFFNSFGFPARILLEPLLSVDKDKNVLSNQSGQLGAFPLNKAKEPINNVLTQESSTGTIPASILRDLLRNGPKYIQFGAVLSIPSSLTDYNTDFIMADSRISTESNLKLPLFGYLNNFKINSEIDYPLPTDVNDVSNTTSGDNFSAELTRAVFKFENSNLIPVEIATKVSFLDTNGVAIEGVSVAFNIAPAKVTASGNVDFNNPVVTKTTVELTTEQYSEINKRCKKVRIEGKFLTTNANNEENVKFYPTNSLTFQMSIFAGAKIKFANE